MQLSIVVIVKSLKNSYKKPVGWYHHSISKTWFQKIFRLIFGIDDFHTHVRWNAIKDFLDLKAKYTLEIGANSGVISFQCASISPGARIDASEYDLFALSDAENIKNKYQKFNNVFFSNTDLREFTASKEFDQILAIDVLEHIDDDAYLLSQIYLSLRVGGSLILSVPTPTYPEVFGRDFHESIGHVRDGYTLEHLAILLKEAGFTLVNYRYHTGYLSSFFCSLIYREKLSGRFRFLLIGILIPFIHFMERSAGDKSAGLAVLATKV